MSVYGRNADRLSDLAADSFGLKVDVIVAGGAELVGRAASEVTETIPMVMTNAADPVEKRGLVASLARPGGNVTELMTFSPELSGERFKLLNEAFPKVSRVAVLTNQARSGTGGTGRRDQGCGARVASSTSNPRSSRRRCL